jgi:hypothetical protein
VEDGRDWTNVLLLLRCIRTAFARVAPTSHDMLPGRNTEVERVNLTGATTT